MLSQPAALGQASTPPPSAPQNAAVNMDLSATSRSLLPGSLVKGAPVAILEGGKILQVTKSALLTPAERLAVYQVVSSGVQTITLAGAGNAVGGSLTIGPRFSQYAQSLTIPAGVSVIDNVCKTPIFSLSGNLINGGSLYAFSSSQSAVPAVISACNIINRGLITTLPPPSALPCLAGMNSSGISAMSLIARQDITNQGVISTNGNLNLSAGGSISNQTSNETTASITGSAVSLLAGNGNIFNNGVITAARGNSNIASATDTLTLNNAAGIIQSIAGNLNISGIDSSRILSLTNTNGALQAPLGEIQIGAAGCGRHSNITISGGDLIAKAVDLFAGSGSAFLNVSKVSSVVNVQAADMIVQADTPDLRLGTLALTADPIIVNSGNVDIASVLPVSAAPFVVVAGRNITSSDQAFAIDTSSSTTSGGNVVLVAGASATINSNTVTISGRSGKGGDINLANLKTPRVIDTCSTAGTGAGGNVTLIAFADAPGGAIGGKVILPGASEILTGGCYLPGAPEPHLPNGNVTVVAEATGKATAGRSIIVGDVITARDSAGQSGAQGTGGIGINVGTPEMLCPVVLSGGSLQPGTGDILAGTFAIGRAVEGAVSTGNLITAGGAVTVKAGGNRQAADSIHTGNISTVPIDPAGQSSGPVTLIGGTTSNGGGSIHTGNINIYGLGDVTILITARDSLTLGDVITGGGPVLLTAGTQTTAGDISFHDISTVTVGLKPASYGTVSVISMGNSGNITGNNITTDTFRPWGPAPAGAVVVSTGGSTTSGFITLSKISCRGALAGYPDEGADVLLTSGMNPATPANTITLGGSYPLIDTSSAGADGSSAVGQIYVVLNSNGRTNISAANTRQKDASGITQATPAVVNTAQTNLVSDTTISFTPGLGATVSGFSPGGFLKVSDATGPIKLTVDTHGDGCLASSYGESGTLFVPIIALSGKLSLTNSSTEINLINKTISTTTKTLVRQSEISLFGQQGIDINAHIQTTAAREAIIPVLETTGGDISLTGTTVGQGFNIGATWTNGSLDVVSPGSITLGAVGPLDSLGALSMSTTTAGNGTIAIGSIIIAPSVQLIANGSGSIKSTSDGGIYAATNKLVLGSPESHGDIGLPKCFGTDAVVVQANTTGQLILRDNGSATVLQSSASKFSFETWSDTAEIAISGPITGYSSVSIKSGSIRQEATGSITAPAISLTADAGNIVLSGSSSVQATNGNISIIANGQIQLLDGGGKTRVDATGGYIFLSAQGDITGGSGAIFQSIGLPGGIEIASGPGSPTTPVNLKNYFSLMPPGFVSPALDPATSTVQDPTLFGANVLVKNNGIAQGLFKRDPDSGAGTIDIAGSTVDILKGAVIFDIRGMSKLSLQGSYFLAMVPPVLPSSSRGEAGPESLTILNLSLPNTNLSYINGVVRVPTDLTPQERPSHFRAAASQLSRLASSESRGIAAALFTETSFSSATVDQLNSTGLVNVQGKDNTLNLERGNIVLAPGRDIAVSSELGTVYIARGAIVFLMRTDESLLVFDLVDNRKGDVLVVSQQRKITASPGIQILLTRTGSPHFERLNPARTIGYRGTHHHGIGNGVTVFISEFSQLSALSQIIPLHELVLSTIPRERRFGGRLLQTAAIIGLLNNRRPYHQFLPLNCRDVF